MYALEQRSELPEGRGHWPLYDPSIAKNGSKSIMACLDVLYFLELVLYGTTVTTIHHPRSRRIHLQEWQRKRAGWLASSALFSAGLARHYCHAFEIVAPGHDRSISKNCHKSSDKGLNMLHTSHLVLCSPAVSTTVRITPGDDRSVTKNGGKSGSFRLHFSACPVQLYCHHLCQQCPP